MSLIIGLYGRYKPKLRRIKGRISEAAEAAPGKLGYFGKSGHAFGRGIFFQPNRGEAIE